MKGLSRMRGNSHVRFLGEGLAVMPSSYPIMWGEPFSLLCLVWLSLLGSVLVVRKNEHLAVTMFDEKLGKTGVFVTDILSAVCVVGFSIFLIVYGIKLAQSGASNNMAGINVPYAFMYSALPVTGVLNIFAVLGHWVMGRKEKK